MDKGGYEEGCARWRFIPVIHQGPGHLPRSTSRPTGYDEVPATARRPWRPGGQVGSAIARVQAEGGVAPGQGGPGKSGWRNAPPQLQQANESLELSSGSAMTLKKPAL